MENWEQYLNIFILLTLSFKLYIYILMPKKTVFFFFPAGSSIASDFLFGDNITFHISCEILRELVP